MNKKLIIQAKQPNCLIDRETNVHNALQDFNLPYLSIDMLENEKNNFFKILRDCVVDVNALQQIANSKVLIAEIPSKFSRLYDQGKIKLDESAKVFGNHTPNLRDGNGNLIGQLTIKEGCNPLNIINAMANMTLYHAVQQVSAQIEAVDKKVSLIYQGQMDDRYAEITGIYETHTLLLSDMQRRSEDHVMRSIQSLKVGLHQIHFEVSRLFEEFEKAPRNKWIFRWRCLVSPLFKRSYANSLSNDLTNINKELFQYYIFVLLTDMLMNDMGQNLQHITANHSDFKKLSERISNNKSLIKKLSFVKEADYDEMDRLRNVDKKYLGLLNENIDSIQLELSQTDIKLLNQ